MELVQHLVGCFLSALIAFAVGARWGAACALRGYNKRVVARLQLAIPANEDVHKEIVLLLRNSPDASRANAYRFVRWINEARRAQRDIERNRI